MVRRSLVIACVLAPLVIVAFVIGLPYGPNGIALAYSVVMALSVVPLIAGCIRGTMISGRDLVPVVGRPVLSALVSGVLAYMAQLLYSPLLSSLSRLALGCGILISSYLGMLFYVMGQKAFYLDLLRGLWQRAPVRDGASATT
jgi:PST family polysaccharide transporter